MLPDPVPSPRRRPTAAVAVAALTTVLLVAGLAVTTTAAGAATRAAAAPGATKTTSTTSTTSTTTTKGGSTKPRPTRTTPSTTTTTSAPTTTTTTTSAPTTTTTTAPAPAPARLAFGVSVAGGPTASRELDHVAALAGEQPSLVLSYVDWTRDLPVVELDAVVARGATPVLTWEPWVAGQGATQPAYALDRIAAGDHDAYVSRFGRDLAAWQARTGTAVHLRFAHEMNGDWYPWAEQANGNGPGDHARAWRHVHALLAAAGADVTWVWSPNVPYPGSVPLAGLFPGTDVVDVVALDGYNWGTSQAWSTWQQPEQLFGPGLVELRTLAPGLPVLVAETASAEAGGDKAAWAADLVGYLATQPDVVGFVWFHHDKETDWRLDSSAEVPPAFRAALAAR